MGVYLYSRLPSAYQEVEYIQSSGTQYINTGYTPTNNTKIRVNMWGWTSSVGQYANLFWARAAWSQTPSTGRGFHLGYDRNNNAYFEMFWKQTDIPASSQWNFSFVNGSDYEIEMSQSWIYQNSNLAFSLDTVTFTSPVNMCIFCDNDNGTANEFGSYKLYSCKMWNSWTLVRDFVPCYRKSDNVIGLYDLVNSQFYTNSWTGTFSKWADVTAYPLKNAYIGEYHDEYEYSYDFTTWSVADFSSQWWTVPSSCSISSSWLTANTQNWTTVNATDFPWLNDAIQGAKNIHIEILWNKGSWTYRRWGLYITGQQDWITFYWDWRNMSGWILISAGGTTLLSGSDTLSTWEHSQKLDIDLQNKLANWNLWWVIIGSWTLTDTDVTQIRAATNFIIPISSGSYIESIKVTIEY